jgi:hypothetical protein
MSEKLERTLEFIDLANTKDPNMELDENGIETAKELLYSKRMSDTLHTFLPNASEHLQIAARAQHIERWTLLRSEYPDGRAGYLKWRKDLGKYHAERTGQLMAEAGYDASDIERVQYIVRKRGIKTDAESQTLEDVICLVFLQYYFDPFVSKHSDEKIIDILQKTWNKMSESGHSAALKLQFNARCADLVQRALSAG